ncbi:hydroxyethylthiazole kinase [Amorphus orientalis]|uniref:Hydroxyethylthiazole kinase n=1 Tax=Amorphus orientalis TaxID=649198 RepID=A0AAE3VRN1_9HYPH|nr:hydroxyethylthiazole kinase [Amorphus orientalis]MDQ0317514.1 hydroxyethylthiazole kinase [Amorphus orientalis]
MSRQTATIDAHSAARVIARVRDWAPLVHCLTNTVAQAFTANVLVALGAVPSMTVHADEVGALVETADSLLINLGTLDPERRAGTEAAVRAAQATGKPWVLDPVKVDRVATRRAFALALLKRDPAIVRGNSAEMAALFPQIAGAQGTVVAVTGARDSLSDGRRTILVDNGDPLLARMIATGCALSALIATCRAVEPDSLLAAVAATATWGIAAERAAIGSPGPGTFAVRLIDEIGEIDTATIERHARIRNG